MFKLFWYNKGFCPLKIEITQFPDFLFSHDVTAAIFLYRTMNRRPCLCTKKTLWELNSFRMLGCVQTDATTPNIVVPTMLLGVVVCVLAVVCKRMQQLPTSLGPTGHRGKETTHKSL